MAVGIHVVYAAPQKVSTVTGLRVAQTDSIMANISNTSTEVRVVSDATVPNSANTPTIEQYLKLEAEDNYVLGHLGQTMIVTYERA